MPTIDARLAEIAESLRQFRISFDQSDKERKKDHDDIVELKGKVGNLVEIVNEIKNDQKSDKKGSLGRMWQTTFIVIAALVGAATSWVVNRLQGKQ